jgi:methyl-accepting chemotaxis protein
MERLKHILILFLCASLIWASLELGWTIRSFRQHTVPILQDGRTAANAVSRAAVAWQLTADRQRQQVEDPQVQRSIGLLLRTGDDLARAIKKFNLTLDTVNRVTLPELNETVVSFRGLVLECKDGIVAFRKGVIEELVRLVQLPEIQTAIASLSKSTESIGIIAKNGAVISGRVDATIKQVEDWVPQLIAELRQIAANAVETTANVGVVSGEAAGILKKINQPLSKKEKFFSVLLKILAASGPLMIETLRR